LLKNSLVKAFAKENSQLSGCRAKQCETGQTRGYELLILSYMVLEYLHNNNKCWIISK